MEFQNLLEQRERMCNTKEGCSTCGLHKSTKAYGYTSCNEFILKRPMEAEGLITMWAHEHPVFTNGEKYKEVFGVEPDITICPYKDTKKCTNKPCENCEFRNFWELDYSAPFHPFR